jgi:TetR/AcrR family transcriptional regulator, transcriptional repressor for nem operon
MKFFLPDYQIKSVYDNGVVEKNIPIGIFLMYLCFHKIKDTMSKADETRKFIIEKTGPIFNKKGYSGTSMSDITEATGLTKGGIYGNFKNKDEIALAVYENNTARVTKDLLDAKRSTGMAIDTLVSIFNYYRINWKITFEKGGCPILNAAVEADDTMPQLKKCVQNTIALWINSVHGIIELGKKQNKIKKDVDSTAYAYTMLTLLEGGIMIAKLNNEPSYLFNALDRIELIINKELKK